MILSPQENEVPCLNCQVRYGKRPGEARNHGLVTVRSSLTVIAIHSLSAVDMELTADLYLYQVHSHIGLVPYQKSIPEYLYRCSKAVGRLLWHALSNCNKSSSGQHSPERQLVYLIIPKFIGLKHRAF